MEMAIKGFQQQRIHPTSVVLGRRSTCIQAALTYKRNKHYPTALGYFHKPSLGTPTGSVWRCWRGHH